MSENSDVIFQRKSLRITKDTVRVGQTNYPIMMIKSADIESEEISKDSLGFFLAAAFFLALLGVYILFYVIYLFFDSQNQIRECASGMMAEGCLGNMFNMIEMVNFVIFFLAFGLLWGARSLFSSYRMRKNLISEGAKMHQVTITMPTITVPALRTADKSEAEEVLGEIRAAIGQGA